MTQKTYRIISITDDYMVSNGADLTAYTEPNLILGKASYTDSSGIHYGQFGIAMVFHTDIPRGSTINSAKIILHTIVDAVSPTTQWHNSIFFADTGDAPTKDELLAMPFDLDNNYYTARVSWAFGRTHGGVLAGSRTVSGTLMAGGGISNFSPDYDYTSPELKDSLQEVVSRGDYGTTDSANGIYSIVAILLPDNDVLEGIPFVPYDDDPGYAPQLIVDYSPPETNTSPDPDLGMLYVKGYSPKTQASVTVEAECAGISITSYAPDIQIIYNIQQGTAYVYSYNPTYYISCVVNMPCASVLVSGCPALINLRYVDMYKAITFNPWQYSKSAAFTTAYTKWVEFNE
jgi:hypothetical protein